MGAGGVRGFTIISIHIPLIPDSCYPISAVYSDAKHHPTHAPDSAGVVYKKDADTEYKILNDIAERIEKLKSQGISVEGGKIKLFTEKDTCGSCSKIIKEFSEAYNIDIEVIHNGGKPIDIKNQ